MSEVQGQRVTDSRGGAQSLPPEWAPEEGQSPRRRDPLYGFFLGCAVLGAVVIVLIAVVWVLTSSLGCPDCGPRPLAIGFGTAHASSVGGVYYDMIPVTSATAGITTDFFGLKITNSSNLAEPSAVQTGSCTVGTAVTGCTISLMCKTDCWYGVLVGQNANTLGVYAPSSVGGNPTWSSTNLGVASVNSLVVVAGGDWFAGEDFILAVFGTGSSSVSGQTTL